MTSFKLSRDSFGHLMLEDAKGQTHYDVVPVRAFPMSDPQGALAIMSKDGHELVWLKSIEQTTAENQTLISEELAGREFMPLLRKIHSVTTFATPSTWGVETSRGMTQLTLRGEEDIRRIQRGMYLISDHHGVEYLIEDIQKLDRHSRKLLDRFL